MEIIIDFDDSVPVSTQLVGQIKKAVLCDRMFPGDALPSIRQLASDLDLDNQTVAKAYRSLERESVIETRALRATVVHPAQLARILRHGADQGWPPSLLDWMKGRQDSMGGQHSLWK